MGTVEEFEQRLGGAGQLLGVGSDDRQEATTVGGGQRVIGLEDLGRRPDRGGVGEHAVHAVAEERVSVEAVGQREHRLALVKPGLIQPEQEVGPARIAADQFLGGTGSAKVLCELRIGGDLIEARDDAALRFSIEVGARDAEAFCDAVDKRGGYRTLFQLDEVEVGRRYSGSPG